MHLKRIVKNAEIWLSILLAIWSIIQLHSVESNVLPSQRPIQFNGNRIVDQTRQPSIVARQQNFQYTPQPHERVSVNAYQPQPATRLSGTSDGVRDSGVDSNCDKEIKPSQVNPAVPLPLPKQQIHPIQQLQQKPAHNVLGQPASVSPNPINVPVARNNNQNEQVDNVRPSNFYQTRPNNQLDLSRESLRRALLSLQNPHLLGGDILIRLGRRKNLPSFTQNALKNSQIPSQSSRLIKFERSALVSSISLWPDGIIYYEFDPSIFHLRELILKVMQQFHDETCIRFVPRLNNEPDFLRIEALRGCFSYIGRIGGEQTLSLGDGCEYRGTIAHELLHSVGFYHHQNRSDRDDFLEIVWENIARGKENQFYKMAPQENVLLNEFDYNSIMLYGPRTFGKTLDKVTMKPKREGVILLEVVEKQGLSAMDANSVNKLYRCQGDTSQKIPFVDL